MLVNIIALLCAVSYTIAMPSAEEIAQIRAEIERLEKLRHDCTDTGIRELIEAWINVEKKKLGPSSAKT